MSARIYHYPRRYLYPGERPTDSISKRCTNRITKEANSKDDDDTAYNILQAIKGLEETHSRKRPLYGSFYELLAYKYGVQAISELDTDALEEFKGDAGKMATICKNNRSPLDVFHEILAQKYGVQSIYELHQNDIEELKDDVNMLVEIARVPSSVCHKGGKVLEFKTPIRRMYSFR